MINEDISVRREDRPAFAPLPSAIYQMEILDINLVPSKRPTYATKDFPPEKQVMEKNFKFQFTILDHRELRGRSVWNNFVPTTLWEGKNGKNDLWLILEAVLGHELTQEEEAMMDKNFINSLIGKQLRIFTVNVTKGDKVYDQCHQYLSVEMLLNSLTEAEKVKATPKKKEWKNESAGLGDVGEGQPVEFHKEDDVKVEDIPF